jgi:methylated-DNA-protein-cysteine methyltransferase-like protein
VKDKREGESESYSFSRRVKDVIRSIPKGKVATYGRVATYAGNPRGARQVVRVLHSSTRKEKLPWHRVVNREGRIALKPDYGYEIQKALLEEEGVEFGENDAIDLAHYLWSPAGEAQTPRAGRLRKTRALKG